MDHIRLHLNGDIEMRTITVNDLMFVLMRNANNEKWIGLSRKIKSFKEIQLAEELKAVFLKDTDSQYHTNLVEDYGIISYI